MPKKVIHATIGGERCKFVSLVDIGADPISGNQMLKESGRPNSTKTADLDFLKKNWSDVPSDLEGRTVLFPGLRDGRDFHFFFHLSMISGEMVEDSSHYENYYWGGDNHYFFQRP